LAVKVKDSPAVAIASDFPTVKKIDGGLFNGGISWELI